MNRVRATLSLATLLAASITLHAQTITGTWQGTLSFSANTTRVVFTIKKGDDGSLHAGMRYVESDFGLVFSSVTFSAPGLTLVQAATGITFHGQLAADGKSITGTLMSGPRSYPLTLSLATPDTLWKPSGPPPMAANADPSFDVATIKPSTPDEVHPSYDLEAREFHATGTSVGELIKIVYKIRGRQIINMAPWVENDRFDIVAKPDTPGTPSEDQTRIMVRKLLAERFHLVCRAGTQLYPVLALTLDPKAPRPTPSDPDFKAHNNAIVFQKSGDYQLQFSGATMQFFLKSLMDRYRDKQIIDETGLTGTYDITLHLPPAALQGIGDGGAEDEVGADYIAAAQKAGFKFTSKKAPIPVVVIDHIDQPTPN